MMKKVVHSLKKPLLGLKKMPLGKNHLWEVFDLKNDRHIYLVVIYSLLFFTINLVAFFTFHPAYNPLDPSSYQLNAENSSSIRGVSGDLWADVVIGKRDFGEIAPREVVPNKLSSPGGVIVDRSVSPGRMYVWDSGNSRILGVDLGKCYGQTSPCSADIVIGQPSGSDNGACNLDASFVSYPNRIPSSASTLCGIPESTHTTLEHKTFVSLDVDSQGNLYVADSFNHRVLKYNSPFTTDTVADDVWGQTDFSGNGCNLTGGIASGFGSAPPQPTASSLCFHTIDGDGSGVTLDAGGNLWIADGGNNRVLRFPNGSKTADLVLGQANFTTGGDSSFGSTMERMNGPAAVRFDSNGKLYVVDSVNNRILVFNAPFTSGMTANGVFASGLNSPQDVEIDPNGLGIWSLEHNAGVIKLWNFDGTLKKELPHMGNNGGGSLGIDAQGNILASAYNYGQDVYRYALQPDATYKITKNLFSPPGGYNQTSARRLEHPAWVGLATVTNQLVVSDGRILFWNDLASLSNGKAPDGYVGVSSFTQVPDGNNDFSMLATDSDNHLYAAKHIGGGLSAINIYQAPLAQGMPPDKSLATVNVLGGGQVNLKDVQGLAVTAHGEFLWVSEPVNHRVLRIRNPLTAPLVDVVLGQLDVSGTQCNRGLVPAPNTGTALVADLTMLCFPGALGLDRRGNLYVSDHTIEIAGNWRTLMFAANLFLDAPSSVVFAPSATKEFPMKTANNSRDHMNFQPAFDSSNRMVIGNNPYSGKRFVDYYNDPTKVNPTDPRDPAYATADGQLKDFYGWPVAITFDSNDNLYVYDANRGQVRIYKRPFAIGSGQPPSPPPPPFPSPFTSPSPTPSPTPAPKDSDNDGFSDDIETYVGTDPMKVCGMNAWPVDIDNDGSASVLDSGMISAHLGAKVGDANYNKRLDLNADGSIDTLDLNIEGQYFGKTCFIADLKIVNSYDTATPPVITGLVPIKNVQTTTAGVSGEITINTGQYVAFQFKTRNVGSADATVATSTTVEAVGSTLAGGKQTIAVGTLTANTSSTLSAKNIAWNRAGTYNMVFRADDGNVLRENSEANDVVLKVNVVKFDSDNDGFDDGLENIIGTNPVADCGNNAWPPDVNNDFQVYLTDANLLNANFTTTKRAYDKRYDLNGDGVVDWDDLIILSNYSSSNTNSGLCGYSAQYFDNADFTGTQVTKREPAVKLSLVNGATPDPQIAADTYSAVWTKSAKFDAVVYRFNVTSLDTGVKVYLDGQKIMETTTIGVNSAAMAVTAGMHNIRLEFSHNTGSTNLLFNYVRAYTCPDLSGDGIVNSTDLLIEAKHPYTTLNPNPWDVNGDNKSNSADQFIIAKLANLKCL